MQTYHKDTKKKRSKLNPIIVELFCFLRREFPVAETRLLKKYFKFICHWCEQGYSPQESCEIVVKESQRKAGTTAKPFEMALIALNRKVTESCYSSYNQLQKYQRHCTVFWLKWPVHDLVLVIPPPPLIKVASNTRPCSKLGGTTLNGREEGDHYYISQTCD